MKSRTYLLGAAIGLLVLLSAGCSKPAQNKIVFEVPPHFNGQVLVQMGIPGAPEMEHQGNIYRIKIPPDGKATTSTVIVGALPEFANTGAGQVWGFNPSVAKTGDGITVGATVEFFVGTKEQYESAEAKKHKSMILRDVRKETLHIS
jgi:hypothetical protein